MSQEKLLNKLMEMQASIRNNVLMNAEVIDTVEKILNSVDGKDTQLQAENIHVNKKYEIDDINAQQIVRNRSQIWSDEVRADLSLVDKVSGKVIDRVKNIKLANVPKLTDRGTYLVGGNEYQFTTQARLKPGVYTKVLSNGEVSSFFNVDKTIDFDRGFNNNFKISFNPDNKLFMMTYGSKNIPLVSALQAVGATKDEMVKSWGKEVYDVNSRARERHTIKDQVKLYQAIFNKLPDKSLTHEQVTKEMKDRLFSTSLDPEVTKITLNKPFDMVNKEALMAASGKIIKINRGEVEPDDREALIFKSFYGPEDHVRERLVKNSAKIISGLKFKLDKTRSINKSISTNTFDPYVVGVITRSQLSTPPEQTNVMSIIGESSKMTVMGEGGVGSANAITNEARQISNTSMGFIDPLHTPEGSNIGIAVHTSIGTIKVGNDLYSKFHTPSGKKVLLRPIDVYDKNVAFPDEMKNKEVKVINRGKFKTVSKGDVDYVVPSHVDMFDTSANMIPFLESIQGNRGLTASKMQEQALSLKHRDAPLFDIVDNNKVSLHETLGTAIGVPRSPVSGTVKSVGDDHIVIVDGDKKEHKVQMYKNFSLNSESYLHNEPLVKEGDKVKADEVLADNNFTKNKRLALGANLKVAYIPFKGYNYEDSAIMSESAAKKLTSNHIYDFKTKRSSDGFFSKSKFKAYYPEELRAKNAAKLDKDGIVQIGQTVDPEDILIAHMEKRTPTADDIALGRLDKQIKRDMGNNAIRWEKDVSGVVVGVEKHGNSVVVSVKTEEPLKVADKISGLHGNKHIISKIISDDQMPYNPKTGERIDLTMSPIGVSNRINTSQLLENAAGKIGAKTGIPYKIQNFSGEDNSRKIMKDLGDAGLSDKDILVDPETNKPFINPVANGVSHILKLEHVVDHKFSARYRDGHDSNEQPVTGGITGGKNLGRMEFAALLARGANENLKEMFQIKGQRNDAYWKAMETGQSLPPPQKAFVWDKMLAMMNGAGINVEQKGKIFQLKPMTDKDIITLSSGEVKDPTLTYRRKNLAPMKNGLFDPATVGGLQGDHFTHFKLPEKVLNPINATAAASLTGLAVTELEGVIIGKKFINKTSGEIVKPGTPGGISGGPAIENLLSRVNIKTELKNALERINETRSPSELNKQHRKIRYLKSLQENGLQPTDYMISNVLVIPSKFRPMFAMGIDKTVIMSDVNDLYQQAGFTSEAMKELKNELDKNIKDEDTKNVSLADVRGAMYKDIKAITGLGEPTSYLHRVKNKKGFISQIDGGDTKQTKEGFFQDKVMERRQDLVGRSTITLNPELGADEAGIPKEMAAKIFQPFIMKKLVGLGYTPLDAQKQINDKSKVFHKAMDLVSGERLVLINRAPSLHQWNIMAFKPKLTEGKTIEMPAIVMSRNYSGDFDGDALQVYSPVSSRATKEAERMKASSSMFKIGWDRVLNTPQMDITVGAWLASKGKGGIDTKLKFETLQDAKKEFNNHKITHADLITVDGVKAPYGMHEINSIIPDDSKKWGVELNQKNIDNWIGEVTKKHNGKVAIGLADKIKEVGNNYVTKYGFTLGVSDTISNRGIRDPLLAEANRKTNFKDPMSIITHFGEAASKGEKQLDNTSDENSMIGISIRSGGGKGIQNTAAITMMPGIVMDANDRPLPIPITKSYSEGLDTSSYWAAAHGARGGNIRRSVSSYMPGWMTKDLINSMYDTRIKSDEPADKEGLEYSISDKRAIANRYLAQDAKNSKGRIIASRNDEINSDTINKLNKHGIKTIHVQSPITDPTPGDGFSSYSYGSDYAGARHKIGDNIGVISSHTVTEPSLNLAMKSFHTGGKFDIAKNKGPAQTSFDVLNRTLRFTTNIPDKSTFAAVDGTVESISPSSIGGYDVTIKGKDHEEVRYIGPNNDPIVKVGASVKSGDLISTGNTTPHDMMKYRGMREAQKHLINEISKVNDHQLDKRDIETMVRGITNTTRVLHPGSSEYVPGDVAPLSTVEYFNNNNLKEEDVEDTTGDHLAFNYSDFKKHQKVTPQMVDMLQKAGVKRVRVFKDQIKHEPFLTPAGIGAKAASSEDWIARLAHNRIRKVLEEGTTQGWKSEITETSHPVPQFVTGVYAK
jgi:DNA-directed RNA polymerase beta subunit